MSKKIIRTSEGLRKTLLDEYENYINGLNTTERMEAGVHLLNSITKSLVGDLEVRKMLNQINAGCESNKAIADLNLNVLLHKQIDTDAED